jgi:polysaccharide export outer membrane protein
VDDSIVIQAFSADEISKTWRIGETGDLNLPMIGRIQANGMTIKELESEIVDRLRKYVTDPQVTVSITEAHSRPVVVSGAVQNPGTYQVEAGSTLFDMLTRAGGLKDAGSTVRVTRDLTSAAIDAAGTTVDTTNQTATATFNLYTVMQGHGSQSEFAIRPYDRISVSPAKETKMVHIAGEVNRPGSVELVTEDQLSLIKLVALAGGLTRSASAGKAVLIRSEGGHANVVGRVNLKRIMSGASHDMTLTAGDIVIVPSSSVSTFLQATSVSAITAGIYVLGRF